MVTNDFPPRLGGIERFVHEIARRFPPGEVVVYTAAQHGGDAFDAAQPYPVVRDRARTLLPTPRVARTARALAFRYGCDRVWFGAAAPLGLLAGRLALPSVATTHGHEAGWAALPGARHALARIAGNADVVTHLTADARRRMAGALGPRARTARLVPGVDTALFRPAGPEERLRSRRELGLGEGPLVLSVSRLVPRKGQDVLLRALPLLRASVPGTTLVIVGSGPHERALRRLAGRLPATCRDAVVFAGAREHDALPPYYAAADVFAMPCRTRRLGLESEGLGIVYLEAAAAGLPVLAGDSGGAPEAVEDGVSGYVVDGGDVRAVAGRLAGLLNDPAARALMGARGRARVEAEWSWETSAGQLRTLLSRTVESW
ncbi:glycosyltransferase family 4 protein [Streptomyces reniochalinae]|uniref:glycosyltransferase family 4 protein n=1 Tax=Streptomyces reniochalinae TaxID=2250578 RepID=UPI001FE3C69C|nr:glycosyltransferase family 4 protein [Streptomyces reniochalinae]